MSRGHRFAVTAAVAVVLWSLWLMHSDTQPPQMSPQTVEPAVVFEEED